MVDSLETILGPPWDFTSAARQYKGELNTWVPLAHDKESWNELIKLWLLRQQVTDHHQVGEHPLPGPCVRYPVRQDDTTDMENETYRW